MVLPAAGVLRKVIEKKQILLEAHLLCAPEEGITVPLRHVHEESIVHATREHGVRVMEDGVRTV